MSGSTVTAAAASAPVVVAPAVGAPATAKPAVAPAPGLVRRMINGLEHWVHAETHKTHSAVKPAQTAPTVTSAAAAAPTVTSAAAPAR